MSPEYVEPALGTRLSEKFVRTGTQLHISDIKSPHHKDIVEVDSLDEVIEALKASDPAELDAGYVSVRTDGTIMVTDVSTTLGLPLPPHFEEARRKTKEEFAKQSPEHSVV